MSRIELHGDTVEELNREWSRWIRRLSEMEDELSSLSQRVDPAVAARRRIDARLLAARRSLEQAVARLRALHGFLQTSLGEYRDAEERLARESAALARLDGGSKSPAHRLWERLEREALSGIGSLGEGMQAAAAEIKDAAGDAVHAGEQALDSLKAGTDRLWDAVESSAAGSFVEGVTDALAENYTFGLAASQSETKHRTAYEAGRLVGDVASGIGGLAEGAAAGGMEAGGLALDATGVGAIAGVPLNIAGAAVAGHAASVLYNGAAHFGEDASRLVQSIRSDHAGGAPRAEGTGEVPKRNYEPSPKHDPQSGWGSPNPILDAETGQELLDSAYSSSKNKQLYNVYEGKLIKFQPDGESGWHSYQVVHPAKEVPADVLRQMVHDGKISKADYNKMVKNSKRGE